MADYHEARIVPHLNPRVDLNQWKWSPAENHYVPGQPSCDGAQYVNPDVISSGVFSKLSVGCLIAINIARGQML